MNEDKFDKEFGIGLYPLKKDPYIIWISNNGHVAYIDIQLLKDTFEFDQDNAPLWLPFVFNPPEIEEGFVYFNGQYYRLEYIIKAMRTLNIETIGIIEMFHIPSGDTNHLLIFSDGINGILIAPTIKEYVDKEKLINLDDIMKKTASDVFVI